MQAYKIWGAKDISGRYISTGIFKASHNLNHTQYIVHTQARERNIEIVVTGIYPTYFTCEVRNKSGNLISAKFDFSIVGNNYSNK